MQQLLHGDSSSVFEIIYGLFQEPIERYLVTRINDQESARELCQDTFERLWNFLLRQETILQPTAYYKNWLYKTATNLAIDKYRHKMLIDFVPLPEDEAYTRFVEMTVEGHESWLCNFDRLQEALAQLSPQYRNCVELHKICGYSLQETAAKLGITESTVSANASRGKARLYRKYFPMTVEPYVDPYVMQYFNGSVRLPPPRGRFGKFRTVFVTGKNGKNYAISLWNGNISEHSKKSPFDEVRRFKLPENLKKYYPKNL